MILNLKSKFEFVYVFLIHASFDIFTPHVSLQLDFKNAHNYSVEIKVKYQN